MDYRLYKSEDFAQIYAIEELCFDPPLRFSHSYMRQLVDSENSATWIAEQDTEIAGFSIVEWAGSKDIGAPGAYIQTIEVRADHRRQGIGNEMLRRLEESAREAGTDLIWLHVDAENTGAIKLYEAHGYRCEGREEHYYSRSRPALVYRKPFENSQSAA